MAKYKRYSNLFRYIYLIFLFTISFVSGFSQIVRYTTTNLNLRSGPSISDKIILVIPRGTPVYLQENCDCEWINISYNGCIGYVSSKYLSKVENISTQQFYSSRIKYYTNSRGIKVQSPTYYDNVPKGATALCRDGTYSFSRSRRGTCSHHGGVARWL